jgi:hypothetical protein
MCTLQSDEVPPATFEGALAESQASGYHLVTPLGVEVVGDTLQALSTAGARVNPHRLLAAI